MSMFETDIKYTEDNEAVEKLKTHTPKGYELHDEKIIKCISCNQDLASLIIVKTNCPCFTIGGKDINTIKVQVKCLKCKMLSFIEVIERCKFYYQAVAPHGLVDVQLLANEEKLILEIK